MKIVVVDDDPLVLHLMKSVLQQRGHEVFTYGNPLDCPLYQGMCPCVIGAPCPDIIFSDYEMPNVNGLELLEAIHARRCHGVHSAIISGRGFAEPELNRLARLGGRIFLKPFEFHQIDDWMNRIKLNFV